MKLLFVMDPLEDVHIHEDTTFAFMLAAQKRGHELYYCGQDELSARGDEAMTVARRVTVQRVEGNHCAINEPNLVSLDEFDVVFQRTDPPFDIDYLHACHILELAEERDVLVVNKPSGLRVANEKLFALHFPEVIPDTLVTSVKQEVFGFASEYDGRCVIKPVDGHGGEAVFVVDLEDGNVNALVEVMTNHGERRIICQQYLPDAQRGDKRIILLDGEPLGAILRVPPEGEHRGNIHVGGTVEKAELTERDHQICETVAPRLRAAGLWFVGLDVIGGYLTEVNVTSPTGIQEMSRFDEIDGSDMVIEWVEAKATET
jgi:glutathione synthase